MPESSSTARAPHSQQECLVFKRAAVSTSSNLVSSTSKLPFKSYLGSSNPSEKREVTPKKLPTEPALDSSQGPWGPGCLTCQASAPYQMFRYYNNLKAVRAITHSGAAWLKPWNKALGRSCWELFHV